MTAKRTMVSTGRAVPSMELLEGAQKGLVVELTKGALTLGRGADNDVVVSGEGISRTHAHLGFSDGAWFIRDNKSKNGILVNGVLVQETWLGDGDVVQIGSVVFRFNEGSLSSNLPSVEEGEKETGALPGEAYRQAKPKANRRPLIYGGPGDCVGGRLLHE